MTKFKILIKSKNHDFSPNSRNSKVGISFFTLKARLVLTHLRNAFVEALIFYYFHPKCYIQIKTNASGYDISGVLSLLAFGTRPDGIVMKADFSQWHPIAFFSRKMIPTEN